MLAEQWNNNVNFVTRHDQHCLRLRFLVGTIIVNVISCYASESGLSTDEKDAFYGRIISLVVVVPDEEYLIGGDFKWA